MSNSCPLLAQVAIERMQVKLSKKMFGERVRWAPAGEVAPLEELFKNLPKSDGEGTQVPHWLLLICGSKNCAQRTYILVTCGPPLEKLLQGLSKPDGKGTLGPFGLL